MTATIAFMLLVMLPAVFGWIVFIWCGLAYLTARRTRKNHDATDAWVRAYNAQCVAKAAGKVQVLTPAKRKRALRAIVGGRDDGPRAA